MSKHTDIEYLSEEVHNSWWKEKERQGFHAPIACPHVKSWFVVGQDEAEEKAFTKHCDWCHVNMYPYKELPEHAKEHDRVTVRAVLEALEKAEKGEMRNDVL